MSVRQRHQVVPVRNAGSAPLTILLEPRGAQHVVEPGTQVLVVARGPIGGELVIHRGVDEIAFNGWAGSRVAVVMGSRAELVARRGQLDHALSNTTAMGIEPPADAVEELTTLNGLLETWEESDPIVMTPTAVN